MSVKARLILAAIGWFVAMIGGALMFAAAIADKTGGIGFMMVLGGFLAYRYGASAIEARRAETQSGSVADESAVPKADAQ